MASSAPTPQDADPFADRRAYARVAVALPAFLQSGGERYHAQLLDVSEGGAKVNCATSLPIGSSVVLDCGIVGRGAVIRWQNGELIGLCFDSQLDARDVAAMIDRSRALATRMEMRD